MRPKTADDISVVLSYRPKETVTVTAAVAVVQAPLARFAAQGLPPGIPTDWALEVVGQLESMNLTDSWSRGCGWQSTPSAGPSNRLVQLPSLRWQLPRYPQQQGAQTLSAIAQQQRSAAGTYSPTVGQMRLERPCSVDDFFCFSIINIMKPIYEDITSDEDDIHREILEDITSDEEELVAAEDLEDITSEEEEEKTLDNNISDEEGTILGYDDDENEHSDEEEIYEPAQIGSGGVTNTSFVVDDFLELGQPSTVFTMLMNT
uniref:Uncharacterized protein n=1 Tax=Romanomermis culicivorax TaxID=13658 RepID=A0A915K1Q4_ROMCU